MQTTDEKKRDSRKFRCSFPGCGKKFALAEYLDMHQASFSHQCDDKPHLDSRRPEFKNVCPLCNSSFIAHKNLQRHMESAHNSPESLGDEDGENACKDCGKRFSSRYNLERHIQLHKGVRYPCTVCGKVYTQKYAWGQHMKVSHKDWREGKSMIAQDSEVV